MKGLKIGMMRGMGGTCGGGGQRTRRPLVRPVGAPGLQLFLLGMVAWAGLAMAADTGALQSKAVSISPSAPGTALTSAVSTINTGGRETAKSFFTNSTALDEKHPLAVGDRLSFRIEEDLEEAKPLTVSDLGELEVPYIGRVPAEGKTCKQLAAEIKAGLEKDYYYHATVVLAVDLKAKSRGKVYIVGPVRTPGPQEIPTDEILTLSKALLRAGGFNDFADRHNVKVTRQPAGGKGDKQILVVDVAQIFDKGKLELDLPLEPGDLILVPERLVRF